MRFYGRVYVEFGERNPRLDSSHHYLPILNLWSIVNELSKPQFTSLDGKLNIQLIYLFPGVIVISHGMMHSVP